MDIVIFGEAEQSSVTWHLIAHSGSGLRVAGFSVDAEYRRHDSLHGLPVVDFEQIESIFPPSSCAMIIPLGWRQMNRFRMRKVAEAKYKGYKLLPFVSGQAMVPEDFIGKPNTIIQPGVVIAPFASIGENCSIRFGSTVSHHVAIEDHCLIATGVTISGNVRVGERSVLGTGAVVRDGINIAPGCFIGAGAVVVSDTQENGVYLGVPARLQSVSSDQLKEVN